MTFQWGFGVRWRLLIAPKRIHLAFRLDTALRLSLCASQCFHEPDTGLFPLQGEHKTRRGNLPKRWSLLNNRTVLVIAILACQNPHTSAYVLKLTELSTSSTSPCCTYRSEQLTGATNTPPWELQVLRFHSHVGTAAENIMYPYQIKRLCGTSP